MSVGIWQKSVTIQELAQNTDFEDLIR